MQTAIAPKTKLQPVTVASAMTASAAAAENREMNKLLDQAITEYLGSCNPVAMSTNHALTGEPEFEVRFGTSNKNTSVKSIKPFNKVDYDAVVHEIIKHGWYSENITGTMMLRVTPTIKQGGPSTNMETEADIFGGAPNANVYKMADIRAEFVGPTMISEYCKSDSIERVLSNIPGADAVVKFTQKNYPKTIQLGNDFSIKSPEPSTEPLSTIMQS